MKLSNVSYNVHGNGLLQLSALQPPVLLANKFLKIKEPPSIYSEEEPLLSAESILNMQLRELKIPLLDKLLSVHQDKIVPLDDEGSVIVKVDPTYGFGSVTSGFMTNYVAQLQSDYSQQVWLYEKASDLQTSFTQQFNLPEIDNSPFHNTQITAEDSARFISGVNISGTTSSSLTTTIIVAHGTLNVSTNSGANISGNGTDTIILTGTREQINTALADLMYTPVADYNGPDRLDVITDDGTQTNTETVNINIVPVQDIANDTANINEDTSTIINVNANDSFENTGHSITAINGIAIAVGGSVTVANGVVILNGDGTLSFTPTPNYNGNTSFTYTVTSGGTTETATVNVTVTPVNDSPVNTVPGNQSTQEDSQLTINGINVADVDGDILTTTLNVSHGILNVTTGGGVIVGNNGTNTVTLTGTPAQINAALAALTYTNTADYHGADVITVITTDGVATDTDTINITINPVNDVADDTANTNEDTPITLDVNANDSFENPGHTITAIDGVAILVGETVNVNNGSVTLNSNGSLNFTPATEYSGITSFTYTVTSGGTTETATVTVTVNTINDTPTNALPGAQTTLEDTQLIINGISVADVDSTVLTTTISVLHGTLTITNLDGGAVITNNGESSVTLSGTATQINDALADLIYESIADYNGPDALTVATSDGTTTGTGTINISITPTADITNDIATTNEDTPINIDVNTNDSFENPGHTITAINATAIAVGDTVAVADGTVTLNANGTLNFTPTPNYNGTTSFTYTVTSGGTTETATVNVTVNAINDAPVNTVPGAQTIAEDTPLAIGGVSVADADGDNLTTVISVTNGILNVTTGGGANITSNGTNSVTLVGTAAQINAALAGLTYTNTADYHGAATLTLITSDGSLSDSDTVNITVTPVIDIADDNATTNEDTPININVNANDTFENPSHTITAINATAIAVGDTAAVADGTVTLNANGTLNFTPTPNYNGTTSFTYTVTSGGTTETATVNVTVNAINDAPVNTVPGAQTIAEDTPLAISGVSVADADGDTLTTIISVTNGILNVTTGGGANISSNGTNSVTLIGTAAQINAALAGLTYTNTADYHGPATLTLITSDGTLSDSDTINITVTPVIDIADDNATTNEDTPINIDVNANDSFENSGHTITAINATAIAVGDTVAVADGTVTLNANGTLNFTPTPNYNGTTSFTYTVTSGGTTETATVNVTVNAINDAPVNTVPGAQTIAEDTPLAISGVSVADADGDTLTTVISVTNGILNVTTGGGANITSNGTNSVTLIGSAAQINAALAGLTYTNTADYHGTATLTLITSDGALSDSDTINITVTPVIDIADDTATTNEDTPININVNANDSFENSGHTITAINATTIAVGDTVAVTNGTVTLNANGTLNFTPTPNYNGTTSFTYTVTSGGTTETATVNVTVNAINDAPVNTVPGAQTIAEDTPLAISGVSVADADGDNLTTVISVTNGILNVTTGGGANISSNGTNSVTLIGTAAQINAALAGLTYTNTADYHGPATLTVVTSDGALSDSDTINITVTPVIDIADDNATTNEDTPININVNANDSFENPGHTITAINATAIAVGDTVAVADGTVTLNANGTLNFTPTPNYNGTTSFTYTVTSGGTTETATVNVTVNAINDAPVNTVPGAQTIAEDTPLAISGVSVADADGDNLTTVISVTNGILNVTTGGGANISSNGTNSVTLVGTAAQINAALAGLTYTNTADYHGPATLTVVTSDGALSDSDTINIAVTPVIDIADDTASTNEDTPININVNANDSFENSGHTITAINATAIAVGDTVAVADGTVTLNANGTLNFTPTPNYNGTTTFTYTVTSGGTTETATVNVTVNAINDAPVNTVPGAQTIAEDTPLAISGVSVADADGDNLTTVISVTNGILNVTTGGGANISSNGTNSVTLVGTAAQINAALAGLTYTNTADYHGAATLTLITSDGSLSDSDTVNITVTPVIDIADDNATTNEDTPININVNANDTFENPSHTITAIDATTIAVGDTVAVANGTVTLNANGTLNFTPTPNYNGTTSFTYTVTSGGTTETATVNVTVNAINDAPVNTVPGAQTIAEDTPLAISGVSVADADGDNLTTVISVTNGILNVTTGGGANISSNGTNSVTLVGTAAQINAALAGLTYTNTADYHGPATLTLITSDGTLSDSDTVNITVTPVIDIADDTATTNEDTPININVNANDSFENSGHTITAINATTIAVGDTVAVANGIVTLNANGTLNFTPTPNYNGTTSFTYTVTSGGTTETATVNVTVNAINDAPVNTVPGAQTIAEDTPLAISGVSVADADGDNLTTVISVTNGILNVTTGGGANISSNGTNSVTLVGSAAQINAALAGLTYTNTADYHGPATLTVVTSDGALSDSDTINITVTPVIDIADDNATTNEDTPINIDVNANDSFENSGHSITAINATAIAVGDTVVVANGIVTLNANGTLNFTPTPNYNGTTSFTYTVTSGGTTETATVNVTVNAINDAPVNTVPGAQTIAEDTPLAISGVSVADADGDNLTTVISVTNGILNVTTGGGANISSNGTNSVTLVGSAAQINAALAGLTYTNTADYHGPATLTVVTSDGTLSDSDTINITVTPVIDIADDNATTNEDTPININVNANDTFENPSHTITAIDATTIAVGDTVAVANGTVTLNANGTLNFTPTPNYNGTTSFTYTVTSGGTTETATVNVTVNAINDAPVNTVPGAQTIAEDTPLAISGVSVADADGDNLTTVISVTNGILNVTTGGGANITSNGTNSVTLVGTAAQINAALAGLTYTNTADYHGAATLTLITSDGTLSDSDTINITVTPVIDIADDTASTNEDTPINIDVNANDSFENSGHSITAINATTIAVGDTVAVTNGTVTLNANGTLNFTPTPNYNGTTSFTYTVTSGGTTETASVNVTVNAINDAPVNTVPGAQTIAEDTPLIITGISVADIDEEILTTTISVANGTLSATPGGGATIDNNGTNTVTLSGTAAQINDALAGLIYTNTADYNGPDVLTVVTNDGTIADTDTITITVTPVVDIADDSVNTNEDTLVTINVDANDSFENPGHTITAINGAAITVGNTVAVTNGSVTLNADGTLNFTPAADYNGSTSFTYTVTSGGTTETATVNVTVNPINDSPTNTIPTAQTTQEDTQLIINGISVADVDSTLLTTIITVSHGVLTINATGGGALISNNGTSTVTLSGTATQINDALAGLAYNSIADYNGPDTLSIITSDGSLADNSSINITVTPVADINNDSVITDEDTLVNIDVNANDTFENPGHIITAINGTTITVGATVTVANGNVTLNSDGSLNFTPAVNYNGTTSFTYTVTSGGTTETATVNVTVNPINDTPTNTLPGDQTTLEDTPLNIGVISVADVDGDILTTTISVTHGILNVATGGGATIGSNGTSTVTMTGTAAQINDALTGLLYTNTGDYHGPDVLTVVTSDGTLSDTDTLNITVTPVADIMDDNTNTNEDTPITINVNANDSFENPGHTITAINGAAITSGGTVAVANGNVTLNADGTLNFTPTPNYNGDTSFTYTVTSGGTTETATVNVTVNPINDTPTNNLPGAQVTLEDNQLTINGLSVADVDSTALTTTISVLHGRLTLTSTGGGVVISNNGTATVTLSGTATQINDALIGLLYNNIADYNGPDTLSIITSDGSLTINDTVSITVTPVIDIANDTVTINEDTPLTIDVNANDSFENPGHTITAINGAAIAIGGTVAVANGIVTLNSNGTLNFTPALDYHGNVSFTYTVTSGGTTETATVNITVNPINDAPTNIIPGAQTTLEDTQLIINGISVADVDGDILTTTISVTHGRLNVTLGTGATLGNNGTGTVTLTGTAAQINAALVGLTYTNTGDYNGPDVLSVVTNDGTITDTDTINITVTPVADIANDVVGTTENNLVIIDVNANDSFENPGHVITAINGTAIAVNGSLAVANGIVFLNPNGTLNFTPTTGYFGTTSFTYTVTSGGVNETATVNVNVSQLVPPVNTLPLPLTTLEDAPIAIAGVSVTGTNGPNLTTTLSVLHGTLNVAFAAGLSISGNGTNTVTVSGSITLINNALAGLTYTSIADYNGSDILTIFTDDGILSDTDSLNITITPVIDITNDISNTNEDTSVIINVNANDSFENPGHLITAINGSAIIVNGSVTVANGTVFLNADGTLNFIPTANFNGTANFTYTVTSGGVTETATVTVTVNPVNDAPVNTVPGSQTIPEDTPLVINGISVADVDGGSLTTTISVTRGTLNATSGGGAIINNNGTNSVTLIGTAAQINAALVGLIYINTADYNGTDLLTIITNDGTLTDTDTIGITVTPVADITNDSANTNEDTPIIINVNANDSFENSGHLITAINGTAILVGGTVVVANGTVTLNANGTLNFIPTTNYNGSTTFTYTVTSGGTTETATVSVTVNPINDAPVNTIPGAQNTQEDVPRSIVGVSVGDVDGDTLTTTISVSHGTLSVSTGGGALISNNGSATVTITGSAAQINAALAGLTYTSTADYNGSDALSIVTNDGQVTDNDTVAITVTPVIDIANDSANTRQNTSVNINVNANDSFENSGHHITAINGTAIAVGGSVAVANGTVTLNANGTLSFTPAANYIGIANFTYTVTSGGVTETAAVNVNVLPFFEGSGQSVLLSTVGTSVVPNFEGAYGLSALNPIQGDLPGLISALIGPGGILQGGTTEDALALILSQQGVFYNTDIVQLTDKGSASNYNYKMVFNGSEQMISYQDVPPSALFGLLPVSTQLALLGYNLGDFHDMGNGNLLFSTTGGGVLPSYNPNTGTFTTIHFDNEDVVLATKQPGGYYTYTLFFNGSVDAHLDDNLLNLFGGQEFILDGLAYTGDLQNGTMYFSLSNLVGVDLGQVLHLDVMNGVLGDGGDVYSIQRVNGSWNINTFNVFFSAASLGWDNELLENALIDLAALHVGTALGDAIYALLGNGQVTRYFDIDAIDVVGNTMYFSVSSILNVELIDLLAGIITNPLDPLYPLTFRGENIYTISRANASSAWDKSTLSLFLDGSNYGLGSSSGPLGNVSDNLIEDVNGFSLDRGDHSQNTIMYSTAGGGNEPQLGGSYNGQEVVQLNNGTFYDSFNLAAITNGTITNNNITGIHVLENGNVLFVLGALATLPGGIVAHPNDIISWNGQQFSMTFDGSANGLPDGSSAIESIYVFPSTSINSGKILMTVDSSASLPGTGVVDNQDIIMFNPTTHTYQMVLDGSTLGIQDVGAQLTIGTSLSAGINTEIHTLFNPLTNALADRVSDTMDVLHTRLEAIQTALHPSGLIGGLLSGLLNLVGNLLTTVDNLVNSLNLGLTTNLGATVDSINANLSSLLTSINNNALTLTLQGVNVTTARNAVNSAITYVNNTIDGLADTADGVTIGINQLINSLNTQLAVGTAIDLSLYDIKIDALHMLNNGNYLVSFAQELNPELDLNLNLNTAFLNNQALANLNLGVNTQTLINGLGTSVDHILAPVLNTTLVADLLNNVLSPDLGLIGNNIYRLAQDSQGHWQFSMYFDGADHGLDNGTAADTVLDYVNSLYSHLTLGELLNNGVLHLSSNEDIDALYVFEQGSSNLITGSAASDLLVGTENVNNTFYGGKGSDVMTGNGGANTYEFDAASVNGQHVDRDVITDFNLNNGDKLLFAHDIFNGGTAPLDNQVHASFINAGGVTGTLLSITQPGNNTVIHEILLMNYAPAVLPPLTEIIQVT